MVASFLIVAAPGTPTWSGRLTPASRILATHAEIAAGLKLICVVM
jgi:hypothetical protein